MTTIHQHQQNLKRLYKQNIIIIIQLYNTGNKANFLEEGTVEVALEDDNRLVRVPLMISLMFCTSALSSSTQPDLSLPILLISFANFLMSSE